MDSREKCDLWLPSDLCENVASWHGGQGSACYSLCSTGLHGSVSIGMLERAAEELEGSAGSYDTPELREERGLLAEELRLLASYPEVYRKT